MGVNREELNNFLVNRATSLRSFYPDGRPRARKITQDELAALVGVPRTTITNIENSRQLMPFHLFYDICLALNIEARDMLPSMDELGQTLRETDQDSFVVEGKNLQSEFEEDVVALVRAALDKA